MTNRWPSCARVSPLASTTNVFLRGLSEAVTCKAHGDESVETVTMTAGPPGENGNGHPSEATATYWGRCLDLRPVVHRGWFHERP